MMSSLNDLIPEVTFNGLSSNISKSLYTVLSISIPKFRNSDLLLFNLDLFGIACSGGSACSSGSSKLSHVISEVNKNDNHVVVRFSFCKYNTLQEIDYVVEKLRYLWYICNVLIFFSFIFKNSAEIYSYPPSKNTISVQIGDS